MIRFVIYALGLVVVIWPVVAAFGIFHVSHYWLALVPPYAYFVGRSTRRIAEDE